MHSLFIGLIAAFGLATGQSDSPNLRIVGNYGVELRLPPEGVFAEEELDIEFRLTDRRRDDPILGAAGVPNAKVEAKVTMPDMPGMAVIRPELHAESRPGDYGLVLTFPHEGRYRLDLRIAPPDGSAFEVAFDFEVLAPTTERPKVELYRLTIAERPPRPHSGSPTKLVFAIEDAKTGALVEHLDVVHEERFHLFAASQDLGWFLHEHPTARPDGKWEIEIQFPGGGQYWLYADVAPSGKGSFVLRNSIDIAGPVRGDQASWAANLGPVTEGALRARLTTEARPIPTKRSTLLTLRITSEGRPVEDIEPWLGALGHLMVVSRDGEHVVHSHPDEANRAEGGEVHFRARFARPGWYRAFAQIQWRGRIYTFPFTLEAR